MLRYRKYAKEFLTCPDSLDQSHPIELPTMMKKFYNLRYPLQETLAICGYQALEMWLVQMRS